MSDHNLDQTPAALRRIIQRNVTDVTTIAPLGAGLDNTAWLVNDEFVIRQAREPDPDAIRREVALLETVARFASLPLPEIAFAEPEAGILGYRMLPGRAALDIPDAHCAIDAHSLGRFLASIHGIPLKEVEWLVLATDEPLQDWLDEAQAGYEQVARILNASARDCIETFLAAPPPPEPERFTFCHNDFGAEHILIVPASMRITGIIDWTDAALADPMRDVALILRDFGSLALDQALSGYGTPLSADDRARLVFHARCKLIEDLAYGHETGSTRYVNAALAHLDWTFT